jgi:ABC-type antimicrobial peptide transport system permease subunit
MVLYFFLVLSLAYIIYYAYVQNFMIVLVFLLVGFLVSFFSKNMIIVLFSALTLSFLINYVMEIRGISIEGMEAKSNNAEEAPAEDDEEMDDTKAAETLSDDIKNTDKKKLIKTIHKQTQDLIKTQNNIIENAEKLKPFVAKITMINDKLSSMSK